MKSIAIFFETNTGKYIKNLIIGVAASVIMVGALFKLEHKPGASQMLTVGLLTEAFIFLLLGLLPPHKDYYWEKIYPGLDESGEVDAYKKGGKHLKSNAPEQKSLNSMFQDANISSDSLKALGDNFHKINIAANDIKDMSNVATATNELTANAKEAASALGEMKSTFSSASNTMMSFNDAASDTISFHQQVQVLSKNLGNLNQIYEIELNDANNHLKAMNKFYGNLVNASESMAASAEDAQNARTQISALANNLSSLNAIYGNMLSAMQGRA